MKYKALIFDLDGTLINTLADLNEAVNFALSKYNYPLRTLENTRNDIGNGVAKLMERSIPDGLNNPNYNDALNIFKEYYKENYFKNSRPYPQIVETVKKLKEKYILAVVSNKFDEGAKKLVNYFFPGIFTLIQGQVDYLRTKPSPDLVNKVLDEIKVKRNEVCYIGDTEVDYLTAQNSTISCVLVTYGYRNKEQLLDKTKGSQFVSEPTDLLKIF